MKCEIPLAFSRGLCPLCRNGLRTSALTDDRRPHNPEVVAMEDEFGVLEECGVPDRKNVQILYPGREGEDTACGL